MSKKYYVIYETNELSRPYKSLERALKSHNNWETGVGILILEGCSAVIRSIEDSQAELEEVKK